MRRRDDEEVTRLISARRASRKERKSMKSKKIDFSDIAELSDKQLSQLRRVGWPTVGDEPKSSSLSVWMRGCCRGYVRPPRKKENRTNRS
jgi:hypothetical protein